MQTLKEIMNELITNEYTVVRLSKDNLADVVPLDAAVYKRQVAPSYYPKKYSTAYTGREFVGYIAYNNEKVAIAYYGVIPCFLQVGSDLVLAAQSADTMTHPQYHYKGLFTELSKMVFELCKQEGIALLFGFPNQNSYKPAVTKLGWLETEQMDGFTIPIKTVPLAGLTSRAGFLKKIYSKYKQSVVDKYLLPQQGVQSSVIKDGYYGIARNEAYFAYKTYSPTHVLKAGKSKLWVSLHNAFIIGDIELNGSIDEVLKTIHKIAVAAGYKKVFFSNSKNTKLHRLFSERYTATPSFPVLFQKLDSNIDISKIKFSFADIDIF